MKKLLLSSFAIICVTVACKTTHKTTQALVQKQAVASIDYCAIKDSILNTNQYQNYYHNELRPKTKFIFNPLPIQDSVIKAWKSQGFRVVNTHGAPKPYQYDSSGYVQEKVWYLSNKIFEQRFKDSIHLASGSLPSQHEINVLITQRKRGIRCEK